MSIDPIRFKLLEADYDALCERSIQQKKLLEAQQVALQRLEAELREMRGELDDQHRFAQKLSMHVLALKGAGGAARAGRQVPAAQAGGPVRRGGCVIIPFGTQAVADSGAGGL